MTRATPAACAVAGQQLRSDKSRGRSGQVPDRLAGGRRRAFDDASLGRLRLGARNA